MNTPSATSAAPVARSIVPRRGRSPRRSGVRYSDATARSTSGAATLGLRPPNDRAGSERLGTLARQGRRTRDPRRRRAARAALGSPTLACPPERLQQGSGVHPRAQQAWSYRIDGGRAPSLLGRRHDARDPDAAADGRYGHFLAGHPDQQWKALGGERGEGFGRCDRVRPGRSGEWIRSSKNLQRSRTAPCSRRYW
jgi:hypothetical protein